MLRHVKHPFPAVTSKNARILILGSVPSVKSVENDFYYMHPQNRFWRVLSRLFDEDFTSMSKVEKSAALIRHDIALYERNVSNKPPSMSITSTATMISPASVANVAISSRSVFLSITHTIAVNNPTPAIFKIIFTSISHLMPVSKAPQVQAIRTT